MDDATRRQAIDLYDRFTHDGMDRRLFMARMVALAGSLAAAEALIGAIAWARIVAFMSGSSPSASLRALGSGYAGPSTGSAQQSGFLLALDCRAAAPLAMTRR